MLAWWRKEEETGQGPHPWRHLNGAEASAPFVRLEVLNASGHPGLASRWTRLLRSLGRYDVTYFGNASLQTSARSLLITRGADLRLAKEISVSLNKQTGLRLLHEVAPGENQELQFTLLLGEDAAESPVLKKNDGLISP